MTEAKTGMGSTRRSFIAGSAGTILAAPALASAVNAAPAHGAPAAPLLPDRRFLPTAIDPATRRLNRLIEADDADLRALGNIDETRKLWSGPPAWPSEWVKAGTPGIAMLPQPPASAISERTIAGNGGKGIRLLVIRPPGPSRGTYFYVHGGGWVAQRPDDYASFFWKLCREASVTVVAPEYRLAPEHPFPAGPDDVLAAARWLAASGQSDFRAPFVIGGDSAGGHLAALTLQRLRDEASLTPFVGADLVCGVYDLDLTPSARLHGPKLPLSTGMIRLCVDWACPRMDRRDPKISPLYGSLAGMPPALFTVGTHDPLMDDTLFMEQRWRGAGHVSTLAVYPGGTHGFDWTPLAIGASSLDRRARFLTERIRSA